MSYGVKGVFNVVPKAALAAAAKAPPMLILGQAMSDFTDLRTEWRNATCVISSVAMSVARARAAGLRSAFFPPAARGPPARSVRLRP